MRLPIRQRARRSRRELEPHRVAVDQRPARALELRHAVLAGAAAAEVRPLEAVPARDVLLGRSRPSREAIDDQLRVSPRARQVEGAFVQGMGWLTTEELWWDDAGRLRTHAPSTYKIPLASDKPREFTVKLANWSENRELTIKRSKAVGEPPFMLAVSVLEALSMAVASVAHYKTCPRLAAPATAERVLMAVTRLKQLES